MTFENITVYETERRQTLPTEPSFREVRLLIEALDSINHHLKRLADHVDPPPPDVVDTGYVAELLGCTKDWIAKMAGSNEIPGRCVVVGTGFGKPWKFHRRLIEAWVSSR